MRTNRAEAEGVSKGKEIKPRKTDQSHSPQ